MIEDEVNIITAVSGSFCVCEFAKLLVYNRFNTHVFLGLLDTAALLHENLPETNCVHSHCHTDIKAINFKTMNE